MNVNTWKTIIKVIAFILGPFLKIISPMIKDLLKDSLRALHEKALDTDNPVDDLFTGLLLDLLGIPRPEEE